MMFFFFNSIVLMLPVLISVAFITLLERKILGLVGLRLGPNKVVMMGLGQPFMDALKLMKKQINSLTNFNFLFYYLSSIIMFFMALLLWILVNLENLSPNLTFMLLMSILGLNTISSISAGWSAFSKYSLIGSIRTVSLMVSYEAVLYIIFMMFIFYYSSFSLSESLTAKILISSIPLISVFFIWWPCVLADLNRTPYDFSEGESELVSGFNTEFGSSSFTLIFLSEYSNIIFFSYLTMFLFFSELQIMFFIIFFTIIWMRSVLPRFRFDKLMLMAWKTLIPTMTLIFLMFSLFFV